eukprot:scaffold133178_cov67-Attheya_sp.AAC.3
MESGDHAVWWILNVVGILVTCQQCTQQFKIMLSLLQPPNKNPQEQPCYYQWAYPAIYWQSANSDEVIPDFMNKAAPL